MKTIKEQFEDFFKRGGLNPADVPLMQFVEMKKAFYFGFGFCLKEMRDGAGDMTEQDAIQQFKNWESELDDYFKELTKG